MRNDGLTAPDYTTTSSNAIQIHAGGLNALNLGGAGAEPLRLIPPGARGMGWPAAIRFLQASCELKYKPFAYMLGKLLVAGCW